MPERNWTEDNEESIKIPNTHPGETHNQMPTFENVMLDVESFGLNLRAPILQIGAVIFNMEGGIGATFDVNVNPFADIYQANFFIDHSTVEFWMANPDNAAARMALFAPPAVPLEIGLQQLADFLFEHKPEYYWARGPQFDLRLLEYAYAVCMKTVAVELVPPAIDWYKVRDERSYTLNLSYDLPDMTASPSAMKHNALSDCLWSIRRIAIVNEMMNRTMPPVNG